MTVGGLKNTRMHRVFRVITIPLLIASQLSAGVSSPARADTSSGTGSEGFLWDEIQPNTSARIAAFANFDGRPGEEVLIDAKVGGFYVTGEDGRFLWRHESRYWMPPIVVPDVDGDERPDLLAQTIRHKGDGGVPTADRRAVLLSGATGDSLWQTTTPEIEGYGTPAAADLNADGELDLVLPGFKNFPNPKIQTVVQVFYGPDFSSGWVGAVPGAGIYNDWSFQHNRLQAIAVGNLDEDASAEVAVGSTDSKTSAGTVQSGFLTVLEGESGAEKWSVETGAMRRVALNDGSVVGYSERGVADCVPAGPLTRCFRGGGELAAYSGSDGSPEWAHVFTRDVISAPLLVGDLDGADGEAEVVVANARHAGAVPGTSEPSLYAFSAEGIPLWHLPLERAASSVALIPRPGGGADVGYGTFQPWDRDFIHEEIGVVSGRTGVPLWTLDHEPEAGRDGINGVGSADIDGEGSSEFVFTTTDHHLTALDPQDGSLRFERSYPGVWTAGSAEDLDGDGAVDVVGGGPDGLVRAVDGDDDSDLWSQPVGGSIARLVVREGSVLGIRLGRHSGVFSLDGRSGEVRWDLDLGYARTAFGFDQKQAAVGDLNGDGKEDALVAVLEGDLPKRSLFSVYPARAVVPPTIVAVDGGSGEILWKIESEQAEYVELSIVDGDVVVATGTFRDSSRVRLSLVDGSTGTERWAIDAPHFAVGKALRLDDLTLVPVHAGRGNRRKDYNVVNAYRTSDGTLAWSQSFECDHRFIAAGARVIAINLCEGTIGILDGDGNLKEVDPGPLERQRVMSAWIAPGSESVQVFSSGMGDDDGHDHADLTTMSFSLVDLEALLAGSVNVLREFHLPADETGLLSLFEDDFQVAATTSGPVTVGFTPFWTGSAFSDLSGREFPRRAWALLLPQKV